MTRKNKFATALSLAAIGLLSIQSAAFAGSVAPGSDWDHLMFGSDCGRSFEFKGEEDELKLWLLAYKKAIFSKSTLEERDLGNKSLSCSFTLSYDGKEKDLKIEQSSGFDEIDKKAMALVSKMTPRNNIAVPPNTLAFARKILVRFSDDSLSVSLARP
jgi:hypothetical protein